MEQIWNDYAGLIAIGAIALLLLLWLVLRPRQRVRLSDNVPLRPHMAAREASHAPHDGIVDTGSADLGDLPHASGPPDALTLLKGVGPKMATMLNQQGITRFDQIAQLSDGQIEALDHSLGAFRGRFARDRITEQAHYLARGDRDGFEQHFGKL